MFYLLQNDCFDESQPLLIGYIDWFNKSNFNQSSNSYNIVSAPVMRDQTIWISQRPMNY